MMYSVIWYLINAHVPHAVDLFALFTSKSEFHFNRRPLRRAVSELSRTASGLCGKRSWGGDKRGVRRRRVWRGRKRLRTVPRLRRRPGHGRLLRAGPQRLVLVLRRSWLLNTFLICCSLSVIDELYVCCYFYYVRLCCGLFSLWMVCLDLDWSYVTNDDSSAWSWIWTPVFGSKARLYTTVKTRV